MQFVNSSKSSTWYTAYIPSISNAQVVATIAIVVAVYGGTVILINTSINLG